LLGGRNFRRGLSIGCGSGHLERTILNLGVCETIDAFDGSEESLCIARAEAEKASLQDRVRYSLGNFNEPQLPPRAYDIVFVHQALHHVAKLEKLYRAILRTLQPNGLLFLDEYIGPSRHDWTDSNFAAHRRLYDSLPAHIRFEPLLPMPIAVDDPSEAIRSSEIVPELLTGFEIVSRVDYGGTVLATLYPFIKPDDEVVASLIETERQWLRDGTRSYYTTIVAQPKRGAAGRVARALYFLVPKLKRIGREIRDRLFKPGFRARP
jgi:SAM-dependent methyltransferase